MAEPARVDAVRRPRTDGWSAPLRQPRDVSRPSDALEAEADRVANSIVGRTGRLRAPAGSTRPTSHRVHVPGIQRQVAEKQTADDKKTNEEKSASAAKKAGEAFMETDLGKKIKERVTGDPLVKDAKEAGEAFIGTLHGKVITGAVAAGVITALAAAHQELPVPIPAIPLDRWAPGLKVKLTYEGPVDSPTKAMITFTYSEGGGRKRASTGGAEKYREETARIRADQAAFQKGMHYTPGSAADLQQKAEEAELKRAIDSRIGRVPGEGGPTGHPGGLGGPVGLEGGPPGVAGGLARPGLTSGLQLTNPSLGYRPKAIRLLESDLQLRPMTDVPSGEGKKKDEDDAGAVMRQPARPDSAARTSTRNVPPAVHATLAGPGRSLDESTRTTMEARFRHDFSRVRIHDDGLAARSADSVNALAYTVANHVVFSAGAYVTGTPAGQRLLAHELAHVVQQGSGSTRAIAKLTVEPGGSESDRQADRAATRAIHGLSAAVDPLPPRAGAGRVQRAEHGTYVSTLDDAGREFLNAGASFYRTWGHPNVRRVSTVAEILNDLDTAKGPIEKFRIVSHATSSGLMLGLMSEVSPDAFKKEESGFVEQKPFRELFIGMHLIAEDLFAKIYKALQKDAATAAAITTLGGTKDVPTPETTLGILLRAITESRFIATAELTTGGPARIANRGALDTFNASRITTYGGRLAGVASPANQPAVRSAIATVQKELANVMTAAGSSFPQLTSAEAASLADNFIEQSGGRTRLKPQLSKGITEGAGGPFLKKLASVQGKVTAATHIEIRGCNVGKDTNLLKSYRAFFGGPTMAPSISAPDLYQFYFQLNTKTYGNAPSEETALRAGFGDPTTGIAQGFEDLRRTQAGEMTRVAEETKLSELATKYGFNAGTIRPLNPEIADPDKLTPGQVVWLVQRAVVPAGIHTKLEDFCRAYLGRSDAAPKVLAANPQLPKSGVLTSADTLTIPKGLLKGRVAGAAPTAADFSAAVRGGAGVVAVNTTINKPLLHVDDPKRATAVGGWLESQKFDPQGRTAAVLSKKYAGGAKAFKAARAGTYIQFLTRGYPNIVDPIFPEDPRYDKHIIRQP
jgi:hypothetical protein